MNPYCRRAVAKACELAGERTGLDASRCSRSGRRPPTTRCAKRSRGGSSAASTSPACTSPIPRSPGPTRSRPRRRSRPRSTREGPVRSRARPAATRSTPTPARSDRSSPSCSTSRSSPACATSRSTATASTPAASTTTAGCRPRCELPGDPVAAPNASPTRRRSTRPGRAAVPAERIRTLSAADLGPGPWGQDAIADLGRSGQGHGRRPGAVALARRAARRTGRRRRAVPRRAGRARLDAEPRADRDAFPVATHVAVRPVVAVVVEPDRAHATRELLGAAAGLAGNVRRGRPSTRPTSPRSAAWGADEIVHLDGEQRRGRRRARASRPGRRRPNRGRPHLVDRVGTRGRAPRRGRVVDAGLTGDAVDLDVEDGRLVAWKPAFGGQLVAAIDATSADPDGDGTRRRAPDARTARTRRHPDPAHRGHAARPSPRARPHPGRRPRRARRGARGDRRRHGRRAGRVRRARAAAHARSAPSSARRARSPTRAGSRAPARSASPAGRSRRACSSASARAASSTTRSACAPRAPCSRSIPIPTRRSGDVADTGIVGDWREVVPLLVAQLP